MSDSEAVRGIRRTARRREHADEIKREATRELRNYCLIAQTEGVSISQIAQEAGLSRQGVYDLLADRPPS
jgi:AcrR family transcriptional regulator